MNRLVPILSSFVAVLAFGALVGCGSDDGSSSSGDDSSESAGPRLDACEVLTRETITEITGADPGVGELEDTGSSTICRYWGDTILIVQIDPGSVMESAQTSEEAYGRTCEPIDDIGQEALYCWSAPTAQGGIGEVVWTDGEQTYYVDFNSGQEDPTIEVPLELANALQP